MLSVSTLSELTTQCATRYYGPRTHSPATKTLRRYTYGIRVFGKMFFRFVFARKRKKGQQERKHGPAGVWDLLHFVLMSSLVK